MTTRKSNIVLIGSEIEENLAIRYLASSLIAHGHVAHIVPFSNAREREEVLRRIRKLKPRLVAISIPFQMHAVSSLELAGAIRDDGYAGHIVVGGHFPTFEFKAILERQPAIDSVGRFDGEETIVALADALAARAGFDEIPNLVYRTPEGLKENACKGSFPDLDALPFPLRSKRMHRRLGENFATLSASRGCWHSACLYCCIGAFHKNKATPFALRSADNVAEEIQGLVERHGVRIFQFHDDNFTLATKDRTLKRVEALTGALHKRGVDTDTLVFLIKARPDSIDREVGDALRALGCTGVFLGIENASKSGLRALCRATKMERIEEALSVLHERGMATTYNLLVFHPKATSEEFRENIQFVEKHIHLPFDIGRAEIVVASPLERQVRELGLLRGAWPRWDYVLAEPMMQRAFELYRYSFRQPQSPFRSIVSNIISFSYHAAIVSKLYPGPIAHSFTLQAESIVRSWNASVVEAMREIIRISSLRDCSEAVERCRMELNHRASEISTEMERARRPMLKFQRIRSIFKRFGVEDTVDGNRLMRKFLG